MVDRVYADPATGDVYVASPTCGWARLTWAPAQYAYLEAVDRPPHVHAVTTHTCGQEQP